MDGNKTIQTMLLSTKHNLSQLLIQSVIFSLLGITLSSCNLGRVELVKEDIVVENCIRVPKQDGELKIRYYGKDDDSTESYDLILDLVVECIREIDSFEDFPFIQVNLLDENEVRLTYLTYNVNRDLFKHKGIKSHIEFSLTLDNDSLSKKELEQIKKKTKHISIQSNIEKTEEEKREEEKKKQEQAAEELSNAILKAMFGL